MSGRVTQLNASSYVDVCVSPLQLNSLQRPKNETRVYMYKRCCVTEQTKLTEAFNFLRLFFQNALLLWEAWTRFRHSTCKATEFPWV
jgi:hypothetical protein